ncbi:MAG: hypothetical protein ABI977_10335 [Acidobacteriota bacterium]
MKYLVPLCLILFFVASYAFAQEQPIRSREILTNDSIISLAKAGFKERTIITLIRTSQTRFDISTMKLVELKKRSVSERVISEMIEITNRGEMAQRLSTLRDDEFFAKDDDAFFNGPIFKQIPSEKQAKRMEDEAMIFGSQSGGSSKTQSRGAGPNSERQQQSETSGSASVRIIRPSSEPGGATPKLERVAKLDNRGVLDMIQAGFSEGTIIRKIETSQVEFDLSPKAVEDLKKNRISERIISVMKTAMDESK